MGNTTTLIIEYLVGGTLMIVAILLVAISFFPSLLLPLLNQPAQAGSTLSNQLILSTTFIALAYGLGIVAEYVGDFCFGWLLNWRKISRMINFTTDNRSLLVDTPLFQSYLQNPITVPSFKGGSGFLGKVRFYATPSKERRTAELAQFVGRMRFYVMNHSTPLYKEISAQISRFRLIRMLFLAEVLIAVAVIQQLTRQPSPFWWTAFLLIVVIALANFSAIYSRFGRYCRAVERSYIILLMEQTAQTK